MSDNRGLTMKKLVVVVAALAIFSGCGPKRPYIDTISCANGVNEDAVIVMPPDQYHPLTWDVFHPDGSRTSVSGDCAAKIPRPPRAKKAGASLSGSERSED